MMWLKNIFKHCLNLLLFEKLFWARCYIHILNLIVQDSLHILYESVEKIRTVVRNIISSPTKYEFYRKCCATVNLKRKNINVNVSHRLNATYTILKLALKQRRSLGLYFVELLQNIRHCYVHLLLNMIGLLLML